MIYVFPKLTKIILGVFRLSGGGLGNLLFPFARAILFANNNDFQLINPTWLAIKLGTILRNEKDKRFYHDLFKPVLGSINGWKKQKLLVTKKKISELYLKSSFCSSFEGDVIVTFEGLGELFDDILRDYEYIRSVLFDIIRDEHKRGLIFDFSKSISIHVRLGDFKIGGQTTDLNWYLDKVNEIRGYLGKCVDVYIFSDGTDVELRPLLNLKNTSRVFFGSSIADMIAMSQSKLLICGKNSTFAQWASYLGRMPVICPRDSSTKPIYFDTPFKERFLEYSEEIDNDFMELLDL